jgi:predicted DNA-binding transcriptional regulator AlpA
VLATCSASNEGSCANGTKFGLPRKIGDTEVRQLREKGITATDIAKMFGVSRATVYRYFSDGVHSPLKFRVSSRGLGNFRLYNDLGVYRHHGTGVKPISRCSPLPTG